MGLSARLPSTDRLFSSRPCEQAQARLVPAGKDRVSLQSQALKTDKLHIPTTTLLYSKGNPTNKPGVVAKGVTEDTQTQTRMGLVSTHAQRQSNGLLSHCATDLPRTAGHK